MRTIAAFTGTRADYGILRTILRGISAAPDLRLQLIVSGSHLSRDFGSTVSAIEADGFEIAERVESLLASDTPSGVAKSIGMGVIGLAQTYARLQPDLLLLCGDRFELLAAASAAIPFVLPIAHLHGGELTEGAFDDQIRHAITKMSHLHFVTTPRCGQRVVQMGEEPWRVTVAGAPALDNLRTMTVLPARELERRLGLTFDEAPIVVTYHPVTMEYGSRHTAVDALLAALKGAGRPIVITAPNADTGNSDIKAAMQRFAEDEPNTVFVESLGTEAYFSLLTIASAMVGNSSSGIIEAASFGLPVVNVGARQAGRERGPNVIDVGDSTADIRAAIGTALSPQFREQLRGVVNVYGDGHAAERIVAVLRKAPDRPRLVAKRFHS